MVIAPVQVLGTPGFVNSHHRSRCERFTNLGQGAVVKVPSVILGVWKVAFGVEFKLKL